MTRPTPEALLEASRHLRQTGTLDERGHLLLAAALGLLASGSFVGASHRIDDLVEHVNDGGLDPYPSSDLADRPEPPTLDQLARALDPAAFEPHPDEARSRVAASRWANRRDVALEHAANLRVSGLLGPVTPEDRAARLAIETRPDTTSTRVQRDAVAARVAVLGLAPADRAALWSRMTVLMATGFRTLAEAADLVLADLETTVDLDRAAAPRDGIDR